MNKYSTSDSLSYCLGMSLTIEALKNKASYVRDVYLSSKASRNEQLSYLLKLCEENGIVPKYDDAVISKLSLKENCYCIGFFEKFYTKLNTNEHIVLYGFNDFGELGTILRSAVSFDFKDIVLINCNIDYFDPKCIRASMGSIFHTNIIKYDSLEEYIKLYSKQNLIPFVSKSKKELDELRIDKNYSIIISQDYYALDDIFNNGYYIKHNHFDEISLSIRSSIILNQIYYLKRNR